MSDTLAATTFQKWVQSFIDKIMAEVNKDGNRRQIQSHIVLPLLNILYAELFPYIIFLVVTLIFILIVAIATMVLAIIHLRKCCCI